MVKLWVPSPFWFFSSMHVQIDFPPSLSFPFAYAQAEYTISGFLQTDKTGTLSTLPYGLWASSSHLGLIGHLHPPETNPTFALRTEVLEAFLVPFPFLNLLSSLSSTLLILPFRLLFVLPATCPLSHFYVSSCSRQKHDKYYAVFLLTCLEFKANVYCNI